MYINLYGKILGGIQNFFFFFVQIFPNIDG